MEYFYISALILSAVIIDYMHRQINKLIDNNMDTLDKLELALERENYLLKTINDALSVTDVVGFIAQRMRNAPKEFKPKTKEEIKPDEIVS